MSPNGSLVGVTSHFTPLPTGEGPGEGPAGVECEASWCRVWGHSFRG